MNNLIKQRLTASLGIESAEIEPVEGADVEVVDEDNTATELGKEVQVQEVQEDEDLIEDAEEAVDTLDETVVAVESLLKDNKGLNKLEALALKKVLQASAGRYVPVEFNLMPAHESFQEDEGDTHNTTLALEGLKENAKEFFKAILAKIKEWIVKIRDIFKAIGDRLPGALNTIKRLQSDFKNMPEFSSQKIEFNTINLVVNNEYDHNKLVEQSEVTARLVNSFFDLHNTEQLAQFLGNSMGAFKENNPDATRWQQAFTGINGLVAGRMIDVVKGGTSDENGVKSVQLPGNRVLSVKIAGGEKLNKFEFTREGLERKEYKSEIETPDKRQFQELLDNAFIILTKANANATQRIQAMEGEAGYVLELVGYSDKDTVHSENKEAAKDISRFIWSFCKVTFKLYDFTNVYARDIMHLCQAAIKAHEKGQKEKAA